MIVGIFQQRYGKLKILVQLSVRNRTSKILNY